MCVAGYIWWPPNYLPGRKAGDTVSERQIWELKNEDGKVGWARFWLNLGGWESGANDEDDLGWTPLIHACGSVTFSERASFAALQLINMAEVIFIDPFTAELFVARNPDKWGNFYLG